MDTPWWSDDDRFLAAVRQAHAAERAVPEEFVAAGKAIFVWQDIDAELAALTYDSAVDEAGAATRGAEHATLRALIFATPELTIELEVGHEALLGQVVPARPGTACTHLVTGDVVTSVIDESGCFVFRPAPAQAFRLQCRPSGGGNVVTDWIAL